MSNIVLSYTMQPRSGDTVIFGLSCDENASVVCLSLLEMSHVVPKLESNESFMQDAQCGEDTSFVA